jgi:hypothetical protein
MRSAERLNPGGWVGGALPPGFLHAAGTVSHGLPQCNPFPTLCPTQPPTRPIVAQKPRRGGVIAASGSHDRARYTGARSGAVAGGGSALAAGARFHPARVLRRGRSPSRPKVDEKRAYIARFSASLRFSCRAPASARRRAPAEARARGAPPARWARLPAGRRGPRRPRRRSRVHGPVSPAHAARRR